MLIRINLPLLCDSFIHKSPPSGGGVSGCSGAGPSFGVSAAFNCEIFPNICRRITHPMYATENNNITFGDIVHPSASSPKNDRELPLPAPPPANGLRPAVYFALAAAIFFASSALFSDIIFNYSLTRKKIIFY